MSDPWQVLVCRSDSPSERAARIRANYAAAEESQRRSVDLYRQIGLDLLEQKKECGHGQWLPWLKANVPFSERHARNYMALAKSAVTADLESAWRVIQGNADEPDAGDEPAEPEGRERPGEESRGLFDGGPGEPPRDSGGGDGPINRPVDGDGDDEPDGRGVNPAAEWTPSELDRKAVLEAGGTVVLNMKEDGALYAWAMQCGRFERIDRRTDWGNPFVLGEDGDRDEVCHAYAVYLGYKRGLLGRVGELKGKALGCWCHPLRCHGDHLADLAEGGVG